MKVIHELRNIRRDVWVYIAFAYLSAFTVDAFIIFNGVSVYKSTYLVALRMWMPGIVGIVLAIFKKKKHLFALLKTVPRLRFILLAYLAPVVIGLISLGLLACSHATPIGARPELILKYHGLEPLLLKVLVFAPTVGLIIPILACLGEELGWRGYLFPQTENLSSSFRRVFNGVVWSIYHWPLILFSDYAASSNRIYSLVMFSIFIVFQSIFICWIQERSQSLWTSVIFHAVHNLWIIGIFPVFYVTNGSTPYLIGEGGVFLTIAYVFGVSTLFYFLKSCSQTTGKL